MKLMNVLLVAALGLAMPLMAGDAASEALVAAATKQVGVITPKALKKMIDNEDDVTMLDVRDPFMREEGNIEGMENVALSRGNLEFEIGKEISDKNTFIVVYCRSGKFAALAAKTLVDDFHYKNVHILEGGIDGWLEAGYSIFNHFGEVQLVKE